MFWAPTSPTFLLPALLLSLNKVPNYLTGKIASDERVVFFPTAANQINSTHWHVPIHGWIFEPELESKKRKVAIKGVGKFLFKVKDEDEKRLLKRRLMPFTVDNQSMKYVNIRIGGGGGSGGEVHRLSRSAKDGHFIGHLTLRHDDLHANAKDGIVHYEALNGGQKRTFAGSVHLIPPTGTSIISDIDDTVKITNYLDKKEFYKNTFLREFREVPGMKELFQKCKSQYDNTSFHYVSASPYQLYEELNNFFQSIGFPPATFHLKKIRVKDKTLLQLFADPQDYKLRQIEPLLRTFPLRKFILVGDSGEKDPEVYKELYRRYPNQIEKIWIRNVNDSNATRMEGVDADRWSYFSDGYDLMNDV